MKPNNQIVTTTGSLGGEKIEMSFDESSLSHLLGLLSNLYSDVELACIREYSTNAADSQKAAGVMTPIEVTTPNRLNPYFRVKDHGVGMNIDDIRNVYSKYGSSTKRESDDYNGILGVGAKSGLSYAAQFTLTGIKDGIKTQVSISRSPTGGGIMEVVDESPTDLPNGVEVSIPVKTYNDFYGKTRHFFKYWNRSEVLIDGVPPQDNNFIRVSDDLYLDPAGTKDVIVMGGVAYPFGSRFSYEFAHHAVLFVPIGTVDFTPSREQLHMTARTVAYIDQVKADIERVIQEYIAETFKDVTKKSEALFKAKDLRKILTRNKVVWNKQQVPHSFRGSCWNVSEYSGNRAQSFGTDNPIIVGFEPKQVTPAHRAKIVKYKEDHSIESQVVTIFDELPTYDWLEDLEVIQWSDIAKIKIAVTTPKTKRTRQPIEVYDFENRQWVRGVPPGKSVLYSFRSEGNRVRNLDDYQQYLKNVVWKEIQPRQETTFKTKYNAVHFDAHIKPILQKAFDDIPDDLPMIIEVDYADRNWAYGKSKDDYDDPELKNIIVRTNEIDRRAQKIHPSVEAAERVINLANRYGVDTSSKTTRMELESIIQKKYPFALNSPYYNADKKLYTKAMNAIYWYDQREEDTK